MSTPEPAPAPAPAEQSIAELLRSLSAETGELVRQEIRVLRSDLETQAKRAGASAGLLGGAALLGLGSFGALTASLIAGLGRHMRTSRAAFLVAALYGGGAAAAALTARDQLQRLGPETAEAVQRDVQAATQGVRDATSG
jgi:Putative Actinobacterial Holin-X, holin superfamily III